MKVFLTGGTGFLGSAVVTRLVARGDEVVALSRSDASTVKLAHLGARAVPGDVTDSAILAEGMRGADAVLHIAGDYRVGIKESEHEAMFLTNVDGTTLVLDAAATSGARRIVYVSTVGVFGNTHGKVVDETYVRPDRDFLSYYDATKYMAHRVAKGRAASGAPIVIVQPGQIYGPGDHSEFGAQLEQAAKGKYRLRMFPELGVTMSHLDDVADGLLLAAGEGRPGEAYVLGGEVARLGDLVDKVADLTGHKRARWKVPAAMMRAAAPLGSVVGPLTGTGANLRETIRASDDVTYWASSDKAKRELGYAPRSLDDGLRDLLAAR